MAASRAGASSSASAAQRAVRLVDPPEQQEAPDLQQPGVGGVLAIAVRRERAQRLGQRPRRPGEIARRQRHLRLGREAARPRDRLPRAEAARRPPQQLPRPPEIPELGHRDPAQGQRGRVVAQGDALERAQRITRATARARRR